MTPEQPALTVLADILDQLSHVKVLEFDVPDAAYSNAIWMFSLLRARKLVRDSERVTLKVAS